MTPLTPLAMIRAGVLAVMVMGGAVAAHADGPEASGETTEPSETALPSASPGSSTRDTQTTAAPAPGARAAAAPGRAREDAALARQLVDELELDAIAITGNDELPSIMHIVPWKPAQPGEVPGRPADSLINDIIAPLDRREYRRQLRYREALAETASDR